MRAIKTGATDCLTKPVDAAVLATAVRAALRMAEAGCQTTAKTETLATRFASLTPREREVMAHVVAGQMNKQIADDLGTGEQIIKLHRAHIMHKMGVESLADLARVAERLRFPPGCAGAANTVATSPRTIPRSSGTAPLDCSTLFIR